MGKHLRYRHGKMYKICYSVEKVRCETVNMSYCLLCKKKEKYIYFIGYLWRDAEAGHGQLWAKKPNGWEKELGG